MPRWLWVGIALASLLAGGAPSLAVDRAALDADYRQQLLALAEKCDELELPDEAALTRGWIVERLADRQYLFVPPPRGPQPPPGDLPRKWHDRFLALRAAQAEKLFALSQQHLKAGDATRAYQALYETLRENPNHEPARAILGFRLADGVWRVPGASTGTRKVSLAHSYLPGFKAGTYWRVTTPHFQITTNAGPAAGQKFGEQLERLHTVWRQAFFRYWSSADELKASFDRPTVAAKLKKPYDVVLFKTRDDYLANLAAAEPRLGMTQGFYSDKKTTAFFYLGDERTEAICHHEVTHQLFQETGDAAREIGAAGNFWIVEGIALYMESLRTFEHAGEPDYVTLGGWDADRLQFARHHVFNGQYQMPLKELSALTREQLQQRKDIKRLYSQSAGLAHYLMDYGGGLYREDTVTWLAGIYAGKDNPDALVHLTRVELYAHDPQYKWFLEVTDKHLQRLDQPTAIRNLALGHQPISKEGLAALAACKNLEWLDLASVPVDDAGLAPLAACKRLDQLNLERTAITDATLAWLGQQAPLRELDLSHTAITDAGVAKLAPLKNLEVLWLTGTPITDASLPVLLRFKKLTTLELDGTQLSPAALDKLRTSLPALSPNP